MWLQATQNENVVVMILGSVVYQLIWVANLLCLRVLGESSRESEKVDAQLKRRHGTSKSDYLAHLSFDLQQGFHGVLNAQRKTQTGSLQLAESLGTFLHLCSE